MTDQAVDQALRLILPEDLEFLRRRGYAFTAVQESGFVCLVVNSYPLPSGYGIQMTDILIRLPAGFPDAAPDMWWCDPWVRLAATAQPPPNADQQEIHAGRTWQRWSRHFPDASAWKAGRSGVESYLAIIQKDLERWVPSN